VQPVVHLAETKEGWVLTLAMSASLRDALLDLTTRETGRVELSDIDMSVSISPNLVPGDPFRVSKVMVVVPDN
jgi:hypothetical protein